MLCEQVKYFPFIRQNGTVSVLTLLLLCNNNEH
jgi:hypothetical protein